MLVCSYQVQSTVFQHWGRGGCQRESLLSWRWDYIRLRLLLPETCCRSPSSIPSHTPPSSLTPSVPFYTSPPPPTTLLPHTPPPPTPPLVPSISLITPFHPTLWPHPLTITTKKSYQTQKFPPDCDEKRIHILEELHTTEQNFLQALNVVVEVCWDAILSCIFRCLAAACLSSILGVVKNFYSQLQNHVTKEEVELLFSTAQVGGA